ncbi:TIGR01906 family membrane protein [Paramaledivibacter caminithermalis]|jgi:integral membrane protein (TIGR01906 family)|uniref:Integral membrane protein TIGR01906 n=1 Tax=Paramaledivibacter caminithermalis (strain DSM 15212 / CIP 107654 / DViRD3) TaxID=1121301 RepID=A0A1M6PRP5_PARC5|nr:TIGR01906 family membrane protein [Paramaledivibacter caminithermalis]SHK10669.1 integral membrane protein TIGR01906 [Paramaledivibacter caminithermalis DSM 15212]
MRKCKIIVNLSKIILVIFLPLAILLTILQYYAFNKDFYIKEFKKYNTVDVTKIGEEDLSNITDILIAYIKGEENDLDIKAVINGEVTEVFGQREKDHMIDVRDLFNKAYIIRSISFWFALIAIIIIIIVSKKSRVDIYQGLLWAGIVPIILMLILYTLVKIDFYKYFTYFHKLLFTNDLWLLDPKTDVLIQMLPLEFFIDISTRIIGCFIFISMTMIIITLTNLKKNKSTKISL